MATQKLAVLGMVIEQPGYGYQIAARVEDRCGAWCWKPSGVYNGLDMLARDEEIRPRDGEGATGHVVQNRRERGAPRIVYEATDKGRESFLNWIKERSPMLPMRDDLEMKIQFATLETVPILVQQTEMQEDVCVGRMLELQQKGCPPGPTTRLPVVAAILQRNREYKALQCRVEWLQETRTALRAVLEQAEK